MLSIGRAFGAGIAFALFLCGEERGLSEKAAWGKYLVEEVGKCQDCHTARDEKGELDKTRWLKGAQLPFQPIGEIPNWHKTAPDITPGSRLWNRWTEAGLLKYLQTGLTPAGKPAGPPMPTYTLKAKDAEAMVEYLKTLK
ncbi:MAG: c-type cytochrome [Bryobacteraceae bacterium]|nr:c-type cytochrome [Bryobacteraceae bacterium]